MQAKRTAPGGEAEMSAAETLALRREQNRLAQKRFRERAKEAKKAKAKQAAEEQAAFRQVAEASRSSSSPPTASPIPRTSGKAVQSLETFAWLANTLSPRGSNARIDAESGLTPKQTNMAIAMCGPDALEEFQRYAKLTPLPQRDSSKARLVAPLPHQSRSHQETNWISPLPPPPPPPPSLTTQQPAFASQDWQAILNQPLMTSSSSNFNVTPPNTSSSHFFVHPNVAQRAPSSFNLDDSLSSHTTVSGGSSATTGDSPEVLETIGTDNFKSPQERVQQRRDALEAVKIYRLLNPAHKNNNNNNNNNINNALISQPGLPNRHDPNREKPFWIFPPVEVQQNHRLPDGRLTGTMTKEWMHSSPYVGLLAWVLQIKAMSSRQFDDWLRPGVVRMENFVFPQSDFLRAMYNNANTLRIGRDRIDDMDAISNIAAAWSLNESSSTGRAEPRRIAPATFPNDNGTEGDGTAEKGKRQVDKNHLCEFRVSQWHEVPQNLHPTKLQLQLQHHPWIDCGFPWPSVRDSILTLLDADLIDEDELCADIIVAGQYDGNEPAFRVWGSDPSDPMAWEVSEEFAHKWHALLNEDIIRRTNWWRKQRGLKPIIIDFAPSTLSVQPPF